MDLRNLKAEEIEFLKKQGCSARDWNDIVISDETSLEEIINVRFGGKVIIEPEVRLINIPGGISLCKICRGAIVENVSRIEFEAEAMCGVGTSVNVLDETGSRPVKIYPGLSSQIATLMAREPKWVENNLKLTFNEFLESRKTGAYIGEGAVVRDCGRLLNVSIGNGVTVEGAISLINGSIINNESSGRPLSYVGAGVDAENFIIEDAKVDSGVILRNCYVGQGVELGKGFTAHDSLFFANCTFENGESCALFAGPYTVSMHKGTLLIGCQTSFLNAGSSTNQSNHMYKLGPVHWGVLERGVKTSSGAYLMLGARIGAFTMVMGSHKTHPDSSSFPFSYLFGDERGATVVVPGAMLRSCGLLRDEKKWPTRDRRKKRKLILNDRIIFDVLNPFTVESMLQSIETINELLSHPADDDLYLRHKGMKFTRASLERAKALYRLAIFKYLSIVLKENKFPVNDGIGYEDWVDVGGQILPRHYLERALECESIDEAEKEFQEAYDNYSQLENTWIGRRFNEEWREQESQITEEAAKFDSLVENDRIEYLEMLGKENKMLSL